MGLVMTLGLTIVWACGETGSGTSGGTAPTDSVASTMEE